MTCEHCTRRDCDGVDGLVQAWGCDDCLLTNVAGNLAVYEAMKIRSEQMKSGRHRDANGDFIDDTPVPCGCCPAPESKKIRSSDDLPPDPLQVDPLRRLVNVWRQRCLYQVADELCALLNERDRK